MDDSRQEAGDSTLTLARAAAEAVRGLNHATSGGLGQPAVAYAVLGELSLAASRLPQLLAQVSRWLAAALAAGQLACDDGTSPAPAIDAAWLFLDGARGTAAALAQDLACAQQQLSAINGEPALRKETS